MHATTSDVVVISKTGKVRVMDVAASEVVTTFLVNPVIDRFGPIMHVMVVAEPDALERLSTASSM